MSYQLRLNPKPDQVLNSLPEPLRSHVSRELLNLAQAPTALSKPVGSLQPLGQLFEIEFSGIFVSVIFRYGQDEATLFIESIQAEFA
jgi:hypothetical protein